MSIYYSVSSVTTISTLTGNMRKERSVIFHTGTTSYNLALLNRSMHSYVFR